MLVRFLVSLHFCVVPPPRAALPGPVIVPFVAPACERCAGHRGVTVAVTGQVHALLDGVVTFDGTVGGRRYLVTRIGTDLRLTYGDLTGDSWEPGTAVRRGMPLGVSGGQIYVGLRRGRRPVDPTLVVGRPGARLVPPRALTCRERPFWPVGLPR